MCNLYPFEKTIAGEGVCVAEAVENIDIGEIIKYFECVFITPRNVRAVRILLECIFVS